VSAHDRRAHRDWLLVAPVRDAGLELLEGRNLGQRHLGLAAVLDHHVQKRHTVLEPEAGISEPGVADLIERGEHLLDELLVLVGAIGLRSVTDHDGGHVDLLRSGARYDDPAATNSPEAV
jgi:hypothetical protein